MIDINKPVYLDGNLLVRTGGVAAAGQTVWKRADGKLINLGDMDFETIYFDICRSGYDWDLSANLERRLSNTPPKPDLNLSPVLDNLQAAVGRARRAGYTVTCTATTAVPKTTVF